jgi:hypothetical protein
VAFNTAINVVHQVYMEIIALPKDSVVTFAK